MLLSYSQKSRLKCIVSKNSYQDNWLIGKKYLNDCKMYDVVDFLKINLPIMIFLFVILELNNRLPIDVN